MFDFEYMFNWKLYVLELQLRERNCKSSTSDQCFHFQKLYVLDFQLRRRGGQQCDLRSNAVLFIAISMERIPLGLQFKQRNRQEFDLASHLKMFNTCSIQNHKCLGAICLISNTSSINSCAFWNLK